MQWKASPCASPTGRPGVRRAYKAGEAWPPARGVQAGGGAPGKHTPRFLPWVLREPPRRCPRQLRAHRMVRRGQVRAAGGPPSGCPGSSRRPDTCLVSWAVALARARLWVRAGFLSRHLPAWQGWRKEGLVRERTEFPTNGMFSTSRCFCVHT